MKLLVAGAQNLRIPLTAEHLAAFEIYRDELVAWNEKFNLTAITDDEGIQVRHFLDSLSCLMAFGGVEALAGKQVIDIGAGAGFPSLPLKLLCPKMRLTLVEATAKKVSFLEHITRRLKLEGVRTLHARAEELGQMPAHREQYDWVLARAVAEFPVLAEYLLPLAKIGGHFLAQKGEGAPAEVQRGEWAVAHLGGEVRRLITVELHGLAETRYLVLVDKIAGTPPAYPRRAGAPAKRPLLAPSATRKEGGGDGPGD